MRLLLAVVVLGALASTALADVPAPRLELRVTAFDTRPGAVAETDIDLRLSAGGPVSILVPAGYVVNLARWPGSVVGTASVTIGGMRRSGVLSAAAGSTWDATGLQVSISAKALELTPPPGATEIDVHLEGVLANPASTTVAVWRATTGGLEARSIVPIPQRIGLRAVAARGRVTLRGRLGAGGRGRRGVNVHLALAPGDDLTKARAIGVATTRADGSFALSYPTTARPLTALAYVNAYVAACATPCVSETIAPPPAEVVSVAIPARPRHGFSARPLG